MATKQRKWVYTMLLNFRIKNFKSFKDEAIFSLNPERIQDIPYSILKETANNKEYKGLSGAVIYGPNAAGKTSIINAMSCFKQIILRGNINNVEDNRFDDYVSQSMELIPFFFDDEFHPVEFEIEFIDNNTKYDYELIIDLGKFGIEKYDRKIISEKLMVNDYEIFKRTTTDIEVNNLSKIQNLLLENFNFSLAQKNIEIAKVNLSKTILFLTTDFNSFISKKICTDILSWLKEKFIVINRSNYHNLRPNIQNDTSTLFIDETLNSIAKEAGIEGTDFGYIRDNGKTNLVSIIKRDGNKATGIDAERIESVGTLRLIGIMPYILNVLTTGGTLVMDELDSSLHPMIVMNIISAFHNDEINLKKAQLIFNTHNPIFLNSQIFRRDEIKFVEKEKETKSSILYSLSDFKTNGNTPVRNTTDYMRNYFINRYGAIENIDFSDIFKEIVEGSIKNEEKKQSN